jgi:hypothetical protein
VGIFGEFYNELTAFYEKFTEILHIFGPQWQKVRRKAAFG